MAAYKHDISTIEYFLTQGAEVNANDDYDRTPLHYVFFNHQEGNPKDVVETLLLKGADVHSKDKKGNSPLHYAAKRGFLDVVKLLLERGAEVNAGNFDNVIPMVSAIKAENIEVVKLLINLGLDVNHVDKLGWRRPLFWAPLDNMEMIECLLANGADVNSVDYFGESLLHYAVKYNTELIEFLFKYNVNPNVKNLNDETPLVYAIIRGRIEIIEKLISQGADVNNINKNRGRTPLCLACEMRNFKIVECLLESGADIDEVDSDGLTPLLGILDCRYIFDGKIELVELLLNYGSNVNILSPCGENILTINNCKLSWKLILQHVAKLQELNLSVSSEITDTISNDHDYNNYFKQCKRELLTAKKNKTS